MLVLTHFQTMSIIVGSTYTNFDISCPPASYGDIIPLSLSKKPCPVPSEDSVLVFFGYAFRQEHIIPVDSPLPVRPVLAPLNHCTGK